MAEATFPFFNKTKFALMIIITFCKRIILPMANVVNLGNGIPVYK